MPTQLGARRQALGEQQVGRRAILDIDYRPVLWKLT